MKKLFIGVMVGLGLMLANMAYSYYLPPALSAYNPTGQLTLSASTTSASGVLATNGSSTPVATTALVQNLGANIAYVYFGASSVVATTASGVPVQPTQSLIFAIRNATHAAAITASGVTTLSVTTGY